MLKYHSVLASDWNKEVTFKQDVKNEGNANYTPRNYYLIQREKQIFTVERTTLTE